ncbi:uncharacterized protein LOC111057926 [Nilaparvata lugens]|uniref:uncharacterized protein LOC111057926 n=1 Tax=Nilaparvata lugens TaxID=108931 RepID=UPI00193E5348|nr:uncharacterized protein LOC111057926 [Nilaparvata lugens]
MNYISFHSKMKSFSIFICVLYVFSGVIATDLSSDEAQSQYSIQSLLQNLCDDHFIGTFFDEDLYDKIFQVAKYGEDSLKYDNIEMHIKNETTFEERLEYTYNLSKVAEPVCLQSACIKNDKYIECMKTNIFLSTIFHALNKNPYDLKRIIDLITETQHQAKQTYRVTENLKQLLKLKYGPIQVRNFLERSGTSSNEASTDRDFEGNLKPQITIGTYRSALVSDDGSDPQYLVSESSSKADIILGKRIRVIRGSNNKTPQPSLSTMNERVDDSLDLLSNANIEKEVAIPDPTEKYSISSEYVISINPTESSIQEKERDVIFLPENNHESNAQMELPNVLENETEISGTEENEVGLTSSLEPLEESVIDNGNESSLTEFMIENDQTSHKDDNSQIIIENPHKDDNSQIIIEGANDVNETVDFNNENLSLKEDLKVIDNKKQEVKKGSSSWSGLGSEQKKTIDNSAIEATHTSSRLVFGITALLIVIGENIEY